MVCLAKNARNGKFKPYCVGLVGLTGLEPVTLRLSSACSNQLSYRPKVRFNRTGGTPSSKESGDMEQSLEVRGLEPLTYSLQSYRSTN